MNLSRLTPAAVGLVAAGALTAAVSSGPSDAAPTAPKPQQTYVLTFMSVTKAELNPTQNTFVDQNSDVQKGKVVGYDVTTGTFNAKTKTFAVHFAAAFKGGTIFGDATAGQSSISGRITGGSGIYKTITGTIKAVPVSGDGADKKTRVTLTYQL